MKESHTFSWLEDLFYSETGIESAGWKYQFSESGRSGDYNHFYTHPNVPNRVLFYDNEFGKYHELIIGTIGIRIVEERFLITE